MEIRSLGFGGKKGLTRNRESATKLGVKGIITICPGCLCMAQVYDAGTGMEYIYILDFIARNLRGGRLAQAIDFYEGCHNYHHHFPSFNLDLKTPLNLLSRIAVLGVH
jgi:hypothetical protein